MATRLTLVVPIYNQLADCAGIIAQVNSTLDSEDYITEFLIIDNGSTDKVEEFIYKSLRPKKVRYVRNEQNLGVIKTMQQGFELAKTEFIGFLHSDTYIYEGYWDSELVRQFDNNKNIGLIGLFGSQGTAENAVRMNMWSNMLEAEKHGLRQSKTIQPVAIVDGFAMFFRRAALEKTGGFDLNYKYHHFYDTDTSLAILKAGYDNAVINFSCHHLSGLTANRSDYQDWVNKKLGVKEKGDMMVYNENKERFNQKWKEVMPLYVKDDWTFENDLPFVGDKIRQ